MPTFRYDKLSAHTYRVIDARTGEAYGVVLEWDDSYWIETAPGHPDWTWAHATREDAARALYTARHAHGFEAGAL